MNPHFEAAHKSLSRTFHILIPPDFCTLSTGSHLNRALLAIITAKKGAGTQTTPPKHIVLVFSDSRDPKLGIIIARYDPYPKGGGTVDLRPPGPPLGGGVAARPGSIPKKKMMMTPLPGLGLARISKESFDIQILGRVSKESFDILILGRISKESF